MVNFSGIDGNFSLVFGTSASAPVVASMITLINDARITNGKNPVGYLNPTVCSPHFTGGYPETKRFIDLHPSFRIFFQ
jgi:tripeptidyl-peptidase-1